MMRCGRRPSWNHAATSSCCPFISWRCLRFDSLSTWCCPVPGQGRRRPRCCARFLMSVELPQVQFIDRVSSSSWTKWLTCPLCTSRVQTCRRRLEVQFIGVDVPVAVHVEGPDVQKTFGGSAGAVHRHGFVELLDEGIDVPVVVHVSGLWSSECARGGPTVAVLGRGF